MRQLVRPSLKYRSTYFEYSRSMLISVLKHLKLKYLIFLFMLPMSTRGQQAEISSISPMFIGDTVGMTLTVFGKGMASIDMTQRMRVGDTACAWTKWISMSAISCLAPTVFIQMIREKCSFQYRSREASIYAFS